MTLSAIFFSFYTVSHYIYLYLKKSLNDDERCLLVPERSYWPDLWSFSRWLAHSLISYFTQILARFARTSTRKVPTRSFATRILPVPSAVINSMLTSTSVVGHSACQGRPMGTKRALSHFCFAFYTHFHKHFRIADFRILYLFTFALLHFRVLYQPL